MVAPLVRSQELERILQQSRWRMRDGVMGEVVQAHHGYCLVPSECGPQ
jgi:hypothetical protein